MTDDLDYYRKNASDLAEFYEGVNPQRTYELITRYFNPGDGLVFDIGCGSGRDAAWLKEKGYKVVGFDAVEEMLDEARRRHPGIEFRQASLPELREIKQGSADNILCSGVLMHLPAEQIITAVSNLKGCLKPGGVLVLSYRTPGANDASDNRAMTEIQVGRLSLLFEGLGMRVLHRETAEDLAGRGHQWFTLVVENAASPLSKGLFRIQNVLEHDRKTATYKYALMRGLCLMTVRDSNSILYSADGTKVYVPVGKMAEYWFRFYWKLTSLNQTSSPTKPVAFFAELKELQARGGDAEVLHRYLDELDTGSLSRELKKVLILIGKNLVRGPVQYTGTKSNPVFSYHGPDLSEKSPGSPTSAVLEDFIGVPFVMWRDLTNFSQWIHDGILVRWAELTAESFHPETTFERVMSLLREDLTDERDQSEVRKWLRASSDLRSVWSGRGIAFKEMCVDHILPISIVGNNDFWNLVPCHSRENAEKSAKIPTRAALESAKPWVLQCWDVYERKAPERFRRQVARSLGGTEGERWRDVAFSRLVELAERVANTRALGRWPARKPDWSDRA